MWTSESEKAGLQKEEKKGSRGSEKQTQAL